LLNQKNYILKANRIPAVEIDDIQKNIRHKIWKEDENDNTVSLGKNSEREVGGHTIRNKL
jgi:hypothetical protein